jgi:hypothetical protein
MKERTFTFLGFGFWQYEEADGFTFARQALYHSRHASNFFFALVIFDIGSHVYAWTTILLFKLPTWMP